MRGRERLARRRRRLEPISRRGRIAALTVACFLLLGGAASVAGGWTEFWCDLGGELGGQICDYLSAFGSLFVLGGSIAAAGGMVVAYRALMRPGAQEGPSGWTRGEGLLVTLSGFTIALLIPTYACPAGYRATIGMAICVSETHRIEPTSRIGLKLAIAALSAVLGLVVARWERIPSLVASVVTLAIGTWALVFLLSKTVGVPW